MVGRLGILRSCVVRLFCGLEIFMLKVSVLVFGLNMVFVDKCLLMLFIWWILRFVLMSVGFCVVFLDLVICSVIGILRIGFLMLILLSDNDFI